MTRTLLRFALATSVLAALAVAAPADAQSATASFQVSANVQRVCTISAASINFGDYNPIAANETAPLDQTGTVTLRCTRGTDYSVELDGGGNFSGGRHMQLGATGELLAYELYSDASRTVVWDAAAPVTGTALNRSPIPLTVYARVPENQDAFQGAYLDNIVATVNF